MALSRKYIFSVEKSLCRKESAGIYPKVYQVGHFPDLHWRVTCPKYTIPVWQLYQIFLYNIAVINCANIDFYLTSTFCQSFKCNMSISHFSCFRHFDLPKDLKIQFWPDPPNKIWGCPNFFLVHFCTLMYFSPIKNVCPPTDPHQNQTCLVLLKFFHHHFGKMTVRNYFRENDIPCFLYVGQMTSSCNIPVSAFSGKRLLWYFGEMPRHPFLYF